MSAASISDAARNYVEGGFLPVPVPYRTKRPVTEGWPGLRLTVADLPRYFNGHPQNIGVLLGHLGLADVDADCPEAVRAATFFLP